MQTEIIHIDDINERYFFYDAAKQNAADNSLQRKRMKQFLFRVISAELTPMQRYCLTENLLGGKSQKEIAVELALNPSTVSRHIAAGTKKLKSAAKFFV